MKRYKSIKRNKTKQRRKTKNRRNKRKKNKTTRKILMGGENPGYNCLNHKCVYETNGPYPTYYKCLENCRPLPPPPPPPPPAPDISGLKLITDFHEIKSATLYILTDGTYPDGDNVFIYLPSLRPIRGKTTNKGVMQQELDQEKSQLEQSPDDPIAQCYVKLLEGIIQNYIDGQDYDDYKWLTYRMANSSSPILSHLCVDRKYNANAWQECLKYATYFKFNKPLFKYLKQKYTIYEFESWPEEIPKPPPSMYSISTTEPYDISSDWRVDHDEVPFASQCPSGWYFNRDLGQPECVKVPAPRPNPLFG